MFNSGFHAFTVNLDEEDRIAGIGCGFNGDGGAFKNGVAGVEGCVIFAFYSQGAVGNGSGEGDGEKLKVAKLNGKRGFAIDSEDVRAVFLRSDSLAVESNLFESLGFRPCGYVKANFSAFGYGSEVKFGAVKSSEGVYVASVSATVRA